MQGIIIENNINSYKIKDCKNSSSKLVLYEATSRGKLKKNEIMPVVGDYIEFEIIDEKNKKAIINKILDRKVYIKRPKLANITQIVFVVSSKNPKPNLILLDKQLVFAEYLGIKALIVLNKMDLDDNLEFEEIKHTYERIGYTVIRNRSQK